MKSIQEGNLKAHEKRMSEAKRSKNEPAFANEKEAAKSALEAIKHVDLNI